MIYATIEVRIFMQSIINWIKQNKLSTALLVLIIGHFLFNYFWSPVFPLKSKRGELAGPGAPAAEFGAQLKSLPFSRPEYPPAPEEEERLVIRESTLSFLVEEVAQVQKVISRKAEELGGYMVNTRLDKPQEAASGRITVRVPQEKLDEALDYYRRLAIKIVSENLYGRDVTDEYVDIESRLETLLKTKTKFEEILAKAEKVDEILRVQRELINLQTQIDHLKGQQNYLEKNAQLSKLTIYLATDELALPYTPSETWRPKVIFKQAIRSLIKTIRKIGTVLIWLAVYSIIWLPILVVFFLLRRRKRKTAS